MPDWGSSAAKRVPGLCTAPGLTCQLLDGDDLTWGFHTLRCHWTWLENYRTEWKAFLNRKITSNHLFLWSILKTAIFDYRRSLITILRGSCLTLIPSIRKGFRTKNRSSMEQPIKADITGGTASDFLGKSLNITHESDSSNMKHRLPSGNLLHSSWKWPSRNSESSQL